jgi:hypothetical protein
VTDAGGGGLEGITVSAGAYYAFSNASGDYTIPGVVTGTYTLTPSKSGYTFDPATRPVTVPPNATEQDFVGTYAPATTGLVYDGPPFLPSGGGFIIDEPQNRVRVSMGDHVQLHLPFRNNTAQTLHNPQVEFAGVLGGDRRPGVYLYNGTDWPVSQSITVTLSDIPPGETAHADFWIYIGNVEPQFRDSLYGQTYIKAYHDDAEWHIPILLSPISFDIPGNQDMTGWSCLHHPDAFSIERYAQYAAGASGTSNPPVQTGDPDTATQALLDLVDRVHNDFHKADGDTGEVRQSDLTLLARRGRVIGVCRDYADLTAGLARSLGLPTRYVAVLYQESWWQWAEGKAHAWNEVYLPVEGGWRHADSLVGKALNEGLYEGPPNRWWIKRVWADLYPLSSACHTSDILCRCVHSCYQAPIDCPDCLRYRVDSPTPWDIFCVEDRRGEYHSVPQGEIGELPASGDALVVHAEAGVFVTRTVPFSASVSILNDSYTSLNRITATVSITGTFLTTMPLFDPDPLYHVLNNVGPGESATVSWEVTPLVAGNPLLRISAFSGELFGFEELRLVVGEPGAPPPLTIDGICNAGQISPGLPLTLTTHVLDENLQTLTDPEAQVGATIFFSPTTEFSTTIALEYQPEVQRYSGKLDLPLDAPSGPYAVHLRASCPGHSPAESWSAFWVAPPVDVTIDLSATAIRPQEVLTITVAVQDRGEPVSTAGVWADIAMPGVPARIPILPTDQGDYVAAFRPADLSAVASGVWIVEATTDYRGSSATAAASLLVLQEVYVPVILRMH